MRCSRGKASPDALTQKRLFADSGGYCQNPECWKELFRDSDGVSLHIAEVAHILAASNEGPRSEREIPIDRRGSYENLILLCPTCHTIVDKSEEKYPDNLLKGWKSSHKERIAKAFGAVMYANRAEVRSVLEPILEENKTIFVRYGPLSEQCLNPESDLPVIWKRKIFAKIIPNNRKILRIIEANLSYLSNKELPIFEDFKQHIDDFEAKHLWAAASSGLPFPKGAASLFSVVEGT